MDTATTNMRSIRSFAEFYPLYLAEHRTRTCRRLHFVGSTLVLLCLALLFAMFSVYAKLVLHQSPKGFTAIIEALTFLSGVQLMYLGVIGEYLGRVY